MILVRGWQFGCFAGVALLGLVSAAQAFMLPSVPTVTGDMQSDGDSEIRTLEQDESDQPTPCPSPCPSPRPFSWNELIANGIAVNFDYRHSKPTFRSTLLAPDGTSASPAFDGETKLNTETVRLEYVPFTFLSVYGIAARHDGRSKLKDSAGNTVGGSSLDGWGGGGGFTAAVAAQEPARERISRVEISPLVVYDFSYTYNKFDDIKGGQDIFTSTGRMGGLFQHPSIPDDLALTLYVGANYRAIEKVQTNSVSRARVSISPDDRWSPVGGLVFSHLVNGRPNFSLIFEATSGAAEYYLLSVRYEYLPKRHH